MADDACKESQHERLGFIAALLIGSAIPAHADTDIWNNMLKQQRGDDALHVDSAFCDAQLGAPQNGTVTSAQYKRCMRTRGWRFSHTVREKDDGYPDPDNPGLVCHDSRSAASRDRPARISERGNRPGGRMIRRRRASP